MGTALNALKMLDYFSNARPEIGLSHLARLSGLNKATALRHLRALEEFGLIEQNPMTKSYAIGPAALRLAALREIARPGIEDARQKMQAAMQVVGESLHLSLLEKTGLQTALVVETTQHSVRVSLDPSEMLPLNATASGLCMLSFGPAHLLEQLDQHVQARFTQATLTDPKLIKERVAKIRVSGWADSRGSYEEGVFGYAAPIFGIDQVALGTIAIAVPETRATGDRLPAILSTLHSLSADLTAGFGGQLPDSFPTGFHP
ncbi:IclR family transcriptional regulator [Ruegeria sp. HKCCD6428]|uniref:IclR family transcriptional regulator n=1 Tax=Ruegeria sp. HKCCD6428 TaxID=2683002 RepID=UPI0014926055|nr:IclR family transcriptional regulator [Ruegeria sp. HKCCD6428]NOC82997.1 helix-turn-helix domain-containing protein [Ruegeria sp. HKCCD6428]